MTLHENQSSGNDFRRRWGETRRLVPRPISQLECFQILGAMMKKLLTLFALVAGLVIIAGPLFAHHGDVPPELSSTQV